MAEPESFQAEREWDHLLAYRQPQHSFVVRQDSLTWPPDSKLAVPRQRLDFGELDGQLLLPSSAATAASAMPITGRASTDGDGQGMRLGDRRPGSAVPHHSASSGRGATDGDHMHLPATTGALPLHNNVNSSGSQPA